MSALRVGAWYRINNAAPAKVLAIFPTAVLTTGRYGLNMLTLNNLFERVPDQDRYPGTWTC